MSKSIVGSIFIKHRFKGMNEYSAAQRSNKYVGAKMKEDETFYAKIGASGHPAIDKKEYPLRVVFTWIEPNKKRDPDNIASGKKFVLDGLVHAGILRNDTQKEIESMQDFFIKADDKENVGVIVDFWSTDG